MPYCTIERKVCQVSILFAMFLLTVIYCYAIMTGMSRPINQREEVKAFYMSRPDVTLMDASDKFGVSYETVRDWSKNERWSVRRRIESLGDEYSEGIPDQAEGIRLVLFSKIIEDSTMDAADLSSLVKAWLSLTSVKKEEVQEMLFDRDQIDLDLRED